MVAGSAVEGYARLVARYPDQSSNLAKTISAVTCQRLVRRLCDDCKVGFEPPPALLQKLGIPPGRVAVLYQPFVPPPVEQQVDENGRPDPIEPCGTCQGRGYLGRIAIFELLQPGDGLRDAVTKSQDVGRLSQIAKSEGHRGIQAEAVMTVARGLTSLDELKTSLRRQVGNPRSSIDLLFAALTHRRPATGDVPPFTKYCTQCHQHPRPSYRPGTNFRCIIRTPRIDTSAMSSPRTPTAPQRCRSTPSASIWTIPRTEPRAKRSPCCSS